MVATQVEIIAWHAEKECKSVRMDPIRHVGDKPEHYTHKLAIFKEARTITQKKRDYGDEKRLATKEEAQKLLLVGFIREA